MNQKIPFSISAKDLNAWLRGRSPKPYLIDVREDEELLVAPFPRSVLHLPLSKSSTWLGSLPEHLPEKQPIVVICHAGVRSWNFGMWLLEQPWGYEVWNLDGGIDAWSMDIDPSVVRY